VGAACTGRCGLWNPERPCVGPPIDICRAPCASFARLPRNTTKASGSAPAAALTRCTRTGRARCAARWRSAGASSRGGTPKSTGRSSHFAPKTTRHNPTSACSAASCRLARGLGASDCKASQEHNSERGHIPLVGSVAQGDHSLRAGGFFQLWGNCFTPDGSHAEHAPIQMPERSGLPLKTPPLSKPKR